MTPLRWLAVAFWLFVGGMLFWQAYTYNANLIQQAHDNPPQKHFFYNPGGPPPEAPAPTPEGPDVQQVAYTTTDGPPGNITCHVTLKNVGKTKAVNVQIQVRPYRGATVGDDEFGHSGAHVIPDSDPLAQIGQSISFPDLAPGDSNTLTATFYAQQGVEPGGNPDPKITFEAEKAKK